MLKTEIDNLEWLGEWYRHQCDGVWENTLGLCLQPLTNACQPSAEPAQRVGWRLTVHLAGTTAAGSKPRSMAFDVPGAGDWIHCSMTAQRFEGAGDESRLEQIIGVFRRWVDDAQREFLADDDLADSEDLLGPSHEALPLEVLMFEAVAAH